MSLRLKSLRPALISVRVRSVPVRVSRPAGRPIVLPVALPTVPRVAVLGSRSPVTFPTGLLVVLLVPIVRPIRELDFTVIERRSVADCFFVIETEGVLLPITVPIFRLRWLRSDDSLLFTLDEVEGLVELTAGCLAPVGADELRVPIKLPIREAPLELAAGCFALLGTDDLVVLIVLPIREVLLGLILLLVLGLLAGAVRERLLSEVERLLDGVLVLIELPIREDMLELIRPFELLRLLELLRVLALLRLVGLDVGRELIDRLDVLLLGVRLVMDLLELLLLGVRLVMDLLDVLLLGVRLVMDLLELLLLGVRLVMDLLDVLLLGVRLVIALLELLLLGVLLVIALLELLLLGVRLDMDLLDVLLLGVRLLMDLLDVLLLGVRLAVTLLELRLDETLLERLDDDDLDVDFGAGAGRLCLLELLDLLLLDRVLAAKTGSAASAKIKMQNAKCKIKEHLAALRRLHNFDI